jgi:hypothetical protein
LRLKRKKFEYHGAKPPDFAPELNTAKTNLLVKRNQISELRIRKTESEQETDASAAQFKELHAHFGAQKKQIWHLTT